MPDSVLQTTISHGSKRRHGTFADRMLFPESPKRPSCSDGCTLSSQIFIEFAHLGAASLTVRHGRRERYGGKDFTGRRGYVIRETF